MENKYETIACFICEQTTEPQKVKYTEVKADGIHYIKFPSLLQTYNVWNRNKRNYFLEPMKKSWAAPHIKELIQRGDFWGEYGHPITKDPKRIVTIDQKFCSHRFTNIYFKGNSVYGDVETLNDDSYGKQFRMRTMQGCDPAFSLRAMVPLTKIDAVRCEIREPGHIITVDSVILPSHEDAYIVGGIEEIKSASGVTESVGYQKNIENRGMDDMTIPVTESSEWMDYLQEESFNLKTVIDHFGIATESIRYNPKSDTVTVTEATDKKGVKLTAVVKMDDYIRREVSDMIARF
jgi:hypothetical protein